MNVGPYNNDIFKLTKEYSQTVQVLSLAHRSLCIISYIDKYKEIGCQSCYTYFIEGRASFDLVHTTQPWTPLSPYKRNTLMTLIGVGKS